MSITASTKNVNCQGVIISDHQNEFNADYQNAYEYMIAIKPGTYSANELSIVPAGNVGKKNTAALTMMPGGVYYLGCVDK